MSKTKPLTLEEQYAEIDRWILDPLYWAKKFLGPDFDPWSGQEDLWNQYGKLLNAKLKRYQGVTLNAEDEQYVNKMGISIMAGQGLGKERSVSGIGLHYLFMLKTYQPKGVCTAPAGPTLHSTLWPEFGKVIAGSEVLSSLFEKQSNRIYLKEDKKRGEFMRIEPRTIQQNSNPDEQSVVLAGIHATGVIYLVTEASGVQDSVFKPLEGGLTDPLSLIIMIFNPTKRGGFAYDSHEKNRRDWVCLQWSGRTLKKEKILNTGRFAWFNENAQDVLIRKFGDDSDFVRMRVDGLPPKSAMDTLIGYEDAIMATERKIDTLPNDPLCVAIDVAGEGGNDKSIIVTLQGPKMTGLKEFDDKNTVQLGDLVAGHVRKELMSQALDAQFQIGVDTIGIGRGVYFHLTDVQRLRNTHMIDVSEKALDEKRFHRLRDQIYWELREAFVENREIAILNDDELVGQLTSIKWGEVDGKIKIQGKGNSSGIPGVPPMASSPDKADALAMAWFLYKHFCSRMPESALSRKRRLLRQKPVSWKVR